ncbi:MAG: hypothetical protein IT330_17215 [Anaerolineae bacterium]|nr:hypothetical protein [Anaerolineae bacterium]
MQGTDLHTVREQRDLTLLPTREGPGEGETSLARLSPHPSPCTHAIFPRLPSGEREEHRVALGGLNVDERGEFAVTAITAGAANGLEYPADMLRASLDAGLWERVTVFVNHPDALEATRAGGRDLERLAGVFHSPAWREHTIPPVEYTGRSTCGGGDIIQRKEASVAIEHGGTDQSHSERSEESQPQNVARDSSAFGLRMTNQRTGGIVGRLHTAGPRGPLLDALAREVLADQEAGLPTPDIGLSADLLIERQGLRVVAIRRVLALDAVFMPARGGAFERALNSVQNQHKGDFAMNEKETDNGRRTADHSQPSVVGDQPWEADIAALRTEVARLAERTVIRGAGETRLQVGPSPTEQMQLALERWWGLPVPDSASAIPRLRSFRDFYILATGDAEMRGAFVPERVQLANATTTTMAELTRNVLNKAIAYRWETLGRAGYLWWEKICHHEDFETLQQVSWVSVGGFADLPDVAEGAAYQELTWDDARETADWAKMGGFIGLTLEMIDRDQSQRIRAIPIALATAALRTLSSKVSSIFTQSGGAGPTLADSVALFHANHGNLGSTGLGTSAWEAAIAAMFKQAEVHSTKRLGIRPRFLLVPIELEKIALQLVGSDVEPADNAFYRNVRAGTASVLVPPEWTDANDWAAAADPEVLPGIGIGYRFGRLPEVFIADGELLGSMFTNDEMRLKVRFLVAVGVINYRALYKANVT